MDLLVSCSLTQAENQSDIVGYDVFQYELYGIPDELRCSLTYNLCLDSVLDPLNVLLYLVESNPQLTEKLINLILAALDRMLTVPMNSSSSRGSSKFWIHNFILNV